MVSEKRLVPDGCGVNYNSNLVPALLKAPTMLSLYFKIMFSDKAQMVGQYLKFEQASALPGCQEVVSCLEGCPVNPCRLVCSVMSGTTKGLNAAHLSPARAVTLTSGTNVPEIFISPEHMQLFDGNRRKDLWTMAEDRREGRRRREGWGGTLLICVIEDT